MFKKHSFHKNLNRNAAGRSDIITPAAGRGDKEAHREVWL